LIVYRWFAIVYQEFDSPHVPNRRQRISFVLNRKKHWFFFLIWWLFRKNVTGFCFHCYPIQWQTNIRQNNRCFRWFDSNNFYSILFLFYFLYNVYSDLSGWSKFVCFRWISLIKANIRCCERINALWHSIVCSRFVATLSNLLIPSIIFSSQSIFRSNSGS